MAATGVVATYYAGYFVGTILYPRLSFAAASRKSLILVLSSAQCAVCLGLAVSDNFGLTAVLRVLSGAIGVVDVLIKVDRSDLFAV